MVFVTVKKILPLLALIGILSSCATREEIERRKLLKRLAQEMQTSQKTNANMISRIQELEDRLGIIHGKVEETAHKSKTEEKRVKMEVEEEINVLKQRLKGLRKSVEDNESTLARIDKKIQQQDSYLKKLLSKLDTLTRKKKTKKRRSPYQQAMHNYGRGKYSTAKKQLIPLLKNKGIKGKRRARIFHNLALIEFMEKDYEKAVTYFSKLLTQHPGSPYNPRGYLYLGKSLDKLGKKEQAKQAYQELIKKFPDTGHAKEARKLIKG